MSRCLPFYIVCFLRHGVFPDSRDRNRPQTCNTKTTHALAPRWPPQTSTNGTHLLGHSNARQSLRNCPNLIHLDQHRIARLYGNAFGKPLTICDEQVVAHKLNPVSWATQLQTLSQGENSFAGAGAGGGGAHSRTLPPTQKRPWPGPLTTRQQGTSGRFEG